MKTSLNPTMLTEAAAALREANVAFAKAHPERVLAANRAHRYGGAQLLPPTRPELAASLSA